MCSFRCPSRKLPGQPHAIIVDYPYDPSIGDYQGEWKGTTCYAGGKQVGSVDGINWDTADGTLHFGVFIKAK